jgi:hypothetical protein
MSPTSYRAAPPRNQGDKTRRGSCFGQHDGVRFDSFRQLLGGSDATARTGETRGVDLCICGEEQFAVITRSSTDCDALRAAAARKDRADSRPVPLFGHLLTTCIRRELPADALHFHNTLMLRSLINFQRRVQCPDRRDFGSRCVRPDLPHRCDELCRRALVGLLEEHEDKVGLASRLIEAALRLSEAAIREHEASRRDER